MVGGVRRKSRREGKESGAPKMATFYPPGRLSFSTYVNSLTYLLMAVTGLGYLALTWSTVVLLGGFVTSLQRKDFWCLTVISMMQAARIFSDLGDELVPMFFNLLITVLRRAVSLAREWLAFQTIGGKPIVPRYKIPYLLKILIIIYPAIVFLPLQAVGYIVVFLYGSGGPVSCIGIALWRILHRDYVSNDGDVTKTNLAPALDMFYCLILCQGALYIIWSCFYSSGAVFVASFRQDYKIPRKWGYTWLVDYLFVSRAKCWRDPASIQGSTLSRYAVDLIDSDSWDDQVSGVTMLATFIRQGADVRSLLLPSRSRIQKLIDTVGCRASASREMREAAACIVAHLAGDIHLAQFPGAIRCISTMLEDEASLAYWWWWNCDQQQGRPHLRTGSRSTMHMLIRVRDNTMDVEEETGTSGCNELILQGLTILERLASDRHNCMDISSTPGLLPKIMAPLCSSTLIQGINNSSTWADVVNGTFKVLCSLIRCPSNTGEILRREISANQQATSNLKSILDRSNGAGQELQMRAMEILTELALDSSTNTSVETKENLMNQQLEIFLLDKESDAISKKLQATAGRTLALLTTNTKVNSSIVDDSFGCLTELFDAKNNIKSRIAAAQILENICAHCDLDKGRVKDTLLPQVLAGIQSNKRGARQRGEENQKNSASAGDEENQNKLAPENGDENHSNSEQVDNSEIQQDISSTTDQSESSGQGNDEQTAIDELLGEFLSLTLVIYDKLISTDDFEDAVQKEGLGNGEFVVKLKTILEENCKETVPSLRIVKLCGQIAASMMSRNQYTEQFKNQGFVDSLSETTKIMSNLESCILFADTDPQLKKIATPLLSELEKEALLLVG